MLIKAKFFQIQPNFIVNKIVPTFASLSAVDTFVNIFSKVCIKNVGRIFLCVPNTKSSIAILQVATFLSVLWTFFLTCDLSMRKGKMRDREDRNSPVSLTGTFPGIPLCSAILERTSLLGNL